MPTSSRVISSADHDLIITLLSLLYLFSSTSDACARKEFIVFGSRRLEYQAMGNLRWMSDSNKEYDVASHDGDIIRLEVLESNPKTELSDEYECLDKVTVYDGSSFQDAVLGVFCGHGLPVFQSSGNSVLLVFEASKLLDETYRGFILNYSGMDRNAYVTHRSRHSVGAGTIALAVITVVIVCSIIIVVLYRRCHNVHRVRRNLAVPGQTHSDIRVAVMARHDASFSQGHDFPSHNGLSSSPISDILTSLNISSRPGSTHGSQRPGRVRHPAGVISPHQTQNPQLTVLYSSHPSIQNDNCSGYGSDRDEPRHRVNSETISYIQHLIPVDASDPSGVFYVGNVDEHGILHPPADQSHIAVSAAPSVMSAGHAYSHVSHCLEDSRRSRESSHSCRSLCPSDRYSSHGSSHDGSSNCCAAYRNRLRNTVVVYSGSAHLLKNMDPEGETFTFYGMIDGDSAAASSGAIVGDVEARSSDSEGSTSSLHNEDASLCGPPPTYEDAAAGKYSPQFPKN